MASQQHFTLNPSYSGPMVLAETLRKMKTNNGLNRMLSTYNKRFFVLDLNHLTFYYLPDKQSHFANSTDIPLSSIIGIKVTKQSQGLEEDKFWKYEFVITTRKKTFELITDSKQFMEKILYAFGNIINTKTNKPLFNWNSYIGPQENQCSPSNFPLPKSADASPQKEKEASFTSPEKSPADITTLQPEQRGEMSAELMKIERASKEEVTQQSPGGDSCSSDDQKENKQSQEGVQKKFAPMYMRRKGNSFAAARGKGFAVDEKNEEKEARSPVKGEQRESGLEQREVKKSLSPVKESLSPLKNGGKIQISVQLLNLDKIESEITGEEEKPMVGSYRGVKKSNPGEMSVRRGANRLLVNNKSASMKNMLEKQDGDFVGFNEIELANNKIKSSKCVVQIQGSARRAESYERQLSFGTGVTQEASKFSLFKQSEKTVEVKKSEKNDDDWDNEMFGEGKHQLSPLKPKNYQEKQNMFSDKKIQSQLSQKRSEFVANRQGTHNDWDDEL